MTPSEGDAEPPRRRLTTRTVASRYMQTASRTSKAAERTGETDPPTVTSSTTTSSSDGFPRRTATAALGPTPRVARLAARTALTRKDSSHQLAPARRPPGTTKAEQPSSAMITSKKPRVEMGETPPPACGSRVTRKPSHNSLVPIGDRSVAKPSPDNDLVKANPAPSLRRQPSRALVGTRATKRASVANASTVEPQLAIPVSPLPKIEDTMCRENVSTPDIPASPTTVHPSPAKDGPEPTSGSTAVSEQWGDRVLGLTTRWLQWVYLNQQMTRQFRARRASAEGQLRAAWLALARLETDIFNTERLVTLAGHLTTVRAPIRTVCRQDLAVIQDGLVLVQAQYAQLAGALQVNTNLMSVADVRPGSQADLLAAVRQTLHGLTLDQDSQSEAVNETQHVTRTVQALTDGLCDELRDLRYVLGLALSVDTLEAAYQSTILPAP
ncbi:hypothetical protein IWQ60_012169 [Tieghemiomyces parasiticus]|uniref:Uncharacterized protein n=1 Tax=Tieghemiomyces parasiticus TaxID=78921 RepID=A0A9W7ZP68_9FUNG|nr:hypothetical protein IWQ60_012169 [Tieghemiomyces parasiticus]